MEHRLAFLMLGSTFILRSSPASDCLMGFLWLAGGGFWKMGGDDAKYDGIWAG
jgi:hypothetical protein